MIDSLQFYMYWIIGGIKKKTIHEFSHNTDDIDFYHEASYLKLL